MAWVSPPTFTNGSMLTGAQMNLLRDNLNETAPAKATAAGRLIVTTGANAVVERAVESATVPVGQTYTGGASSYADLTTPGPTVTVTTGVRAMVFASAQVENATAGGGGLVGVAVSGATSVSAVTLIRQMSSVANERAICTGHYMFGPDTTPLNAGSNTFKLQYTTPTGGNATFTGRLITVIAL